MKQEYITITGARENNLKNVSLKIPKGKITVFTGVSGSGKSSILFDTIAQEAGRQLNETYDSFVRLFLPRYSRPRVDEIRGISPAIVVDQKRLGGNARSTLGTITDINSLLRVLFSRFGNPNIGFANAYSFNDPSGMCPECEGIGSVITLNIDNTLDKEKSINEGAILIPNYTVGSFYWKTMANSKLFDNDKSIKDYSSQELDLLLHSSPQKVEVDGYNTSFEGLAVRFMRTKVKTEKETTTRGAKEMERLLITCTCPLCDGKRYNDKVLSSKINGYNIHDLTTFQLDELTAVLREWNEPMAKPVLDGILERVNHLCDIGLGYLTLTRETATLSGGESQRVKMTKHLSGSLTGMIYIFDEPSIGLHPRDVYRLNELLAKLRDKGNTVLVVEHDPDVIKIADHIIDVGPGAGTGGGEIMYEGNYAGLLSSDTLTGRYLDRKSEINTAPRTPNSFVESKNSSLHNLKNVALRVPAGLFTVVTGVAGSGKSSLVNGVFLKEHPEAIWLDQKPIHANSRSTPATFTDIMNTIRKCFAGTNHVESGLFSANSIGGCVTCHGTGVVKLNLSYMDKVEVECSECGGKRFKPEVLQYQYKGKNIAEVMRMTVGEALDFFEEKVIQSKLKGMRMVGLDYLTLGQPMDTLSGGECQRMKLARELNKKGNIYILDEPTTGLHMSDISNILSIIGKLVDKGNTVVVVEHNLDVIRQADWLIDMGVDGGSRGGRILFEGKPTDLPMCKESITAKFIG